MFVHRFTEVNSYLAVLVFHGLDPYSVAKVGQNRMVKYGGYLAVFRLYFDAQSRRYENIKNH